MKKSVTPGEVDAFIWQLKVLIAVIVVLFLIPLFVYAIYLDRRTGSLEDSLRYRPPQETVNGTDLVAEGDHTYPAASLVLGQMVYVPAYSHVYHGDGDPHLLTITLSIRNTSLTQEIVVRSVKYCDSKGQLVKSFLTKPVRVAALGSTELLVERSDASGGSGANFLVEWISSTPVTEPVIEAVMIDTRSQQGMSFVCRGTVVGEVTPQSGTPTAFPSATPSEQQ